MRVRCHRNTYPTVACVSFTSEPRTVKSSCRVRSVALHCNRFGFASNAVNGCALPISQHVLGETVYGECPPCCSNVRAIRAAAGTDDTELTYSRWMVPAEDKCLAWGQICFSTAHFADVPQFAFGAIHSPSSARRNYVRRPAGDAKTRNPTSLSFEPIEWRAPLLAPTDGLRGRDGTRRSNKDACRRDGAAAPTQRLIPINPVTFGYRHCARLSAPFTDMHRGGLGLVQQIHEYLVDVDVMSVRLGAIAQRPELLPDLTHLVVNVERAKLQVKACDQRVPPRPASDRFAPPRRNPQQHGSQRITVLTCIGWKVQDLVTNIWHGARQAAG